MNALFFDRFGGPEVLQFGAVVDPRPSDGEVLVRTGAIGLNFADVYRRLAECFPLARGADAHRYLESRAAIGKVLLVP